MVRFFSSLGGSGVPDVCRTRGFPLTPSLRPSPARRKEVIIDDVRAPTPPPTPPAVQPVQPAVTEAAILQGLANVTDHLLADISVVVLIAVVRFVRHYIDLVLTWWYNSPPLPFRDGNSPIVFSPHLPFVMLYIWTPLTSGCRC